MAIVIVLLFNSSSFCFMKICILSFRCTMLKSLRSPKVTLSETAYTIKHHATHISNTNTYKHNDISRSNNPYNINICGVARRHHKNIARIRLEKTTKTKSPSINNHSTTDHKHTYSPGNFGNTRKLRRLHKPYI